MRSERNTVQNVLLEFLCESLFCGGEMCQGHAQHSTAESPGGSPIFIDIFHAKYDTESSHAKQ